MRVCIVGAGAIGGLVGARLARSGEHVSVVARGENLDAILRNGLTVVEPDGSHWSATVAAACADLDDLGPQDVIVLGLKAHQLAGMADRLPALYDASSIVVPMQNGVPWWFFQRFPGKYEGTRLHTLDPDGILERHIPPERIVASIPYPAAERVEPGVIRLIEGDRFPVGELSGERTERVGAIAHALSASGFTSRVLTDVRAHLWVKAWGNLAFNPISALTRATLAGICADAATRALAAQVMQEAADIASKIGLRLRISIEQRIEGAAGVGEHKTSMLQDVEAGRELEVGPLIGSFVELGRLTETPTPATDVIFALTSLLNHTLTKGVS
ncbi:MAG TPA: 2-dehydropantoate 2-reductase [Ilumatobacter sp.]|nr:2-dehydropantoate 2-reductase [Ilumatobacter sp.]